MRDERIQKVLSEQGVCSRRAAEQLIREGRVKLNGRPVGLGDKMDTAKDLLSVDGETVYIPRKTEKYYYMLHKPRGYITTMSDELGRKTVMELMDGVPARVFPVGRLDKDSEGLLLLTNDGEFANLLMHPSHGITKLYRATVRPHATEEQILQLTDGVVLDDGERTQPAIIRVVTDEPERTVLEMTIREGKNRQIRRMCEAVGLDVIRLRRTAEGAVKLGMLAPGKYRELTPAEVAALRAAAGKGKAAAVIEKNTQANAERRESAARRPEHGVRAPKGGVQRAARGFAPGEGTSGRSGGFAHDGAREAPRGRSGAPSRSRGRTGAGEGTPGRTGASSHSNGRAGGSACSSGRTGGTRSNAFSSGGARSGSRPAAKRPGSASRAAFKTRKKEDQ